MQSRIAKRYKYKMINFDDITNENVSEQIRFAHIFRIIYTEYYK